jgi:signal recognition particle subunit SRP54
MFDGVKNVFKKIFRAGYVDEKLLEEIIKDLQRELISSDVDVKLVAEISKNIREKVTKGKKHFSKKEQFVKVIYDELVALLGEGGTININKKPFRILLVGLFGSGKTTTAGKMATFYKKRGYKTLLLGLDTFRPAAQEQLKQIGERIGIPVYAEKKMNDTLKMLENDKTKYDIIIADSAGRDALDKGLIKEVKEIYKKFKPDNTQLVLSGDIGQNARIQASEFHKNLSINGVIITKLDGTAKGGGALVACSIPGVRVFFTGTGEKMEDFEVFNPTRFISRITGMGDLETLLEKAKEVIDEEKAEKDTKKFMSGEINLLDLYEQLGNLQKMGPLDKVVNMVPGLSMAKLPKKLDVQESKMLKFRNIMDSMTKEELESPKLLNPSRIGRIAKGAGATESEVRELIKQYNTMKKAVKGLGNKNVMKMMKRFGL